MGKRKVPNDICEPFEPAMTPEARENQLTAMAYDAAAERFANGTATAQEIVYFLKLGSPKSKLEKQKLEKEVKLLDAKTEALQTAKRMEELYSRAMAMMSEYEGTDEDDEEFYGTDL